MRVVELRRIAKELGVVNYYKLNKSELEAELTVNAELAITVDEVVDLEITVTEEHDTLYLDYQATDYSDIKAYDNTIYVAEDVECDYMNDAYEIKKFDFDRYANFNPNSIPAHLRTLGVTPKQLDLVKALENNFKVKISLAADRYSMSVKIANVYNAIKKGVVAKRSTDEIIARVKYFKHTEDNKATKAQINEINRLERETGVTNTSIVKDKYIADGIINNYLDLLERSEVAITTVEHEDTIQDKLSNQTFRTKLAAFFKRVFA